MFFVGAIFAGVIRLELITPQGDLVGSDTYNKMFTMHGIIMVFFFLIPSIPATLGNFLVPMMIGARDLAFPRVNLLSWYLYITGAAITLTALISGGVDTGWTFYTPFSSSFSNTPRRMADGRDLHRRFLLHPDRAELHRHHPHNARAGDDLDAPAAVPVVHLRDGRDHGARHAGASRSLSRWSPPSACSAGHLQSRLGGDPILFQHMFWFYSHPAVYIMILPGMGVVSEVVACFSRKRVFGYGFVAFASLAIAILGFLVWGHHMFVSGQSIFAGHGVLAFELYGRRPVGDQGIQLDRDHVQRLHLDGHADALCLRIHRAVHDGRAYRADGGFARG